MNKEEKEQFIENMCIVIKKSMLQKVNKMPDSWDGYELRQLFSDFVSEDIAYLKMNRKRMKEYKNTRIINNI